MEKSKNKKMMKTKIRKKKRERPLKIDFGKVLCIFLWRELKPAGRGLFFLPQKTEKNRKKIKKTKNIKKKKIFEGQDTPQRKSGHISLQSLKNALKTYGTNKLTSEKAIKLLNQIDCDEHGYFDYVKYVNIMMNE